MASIHLPMQAASRRRILLERSLGSFLIDPWEAEVRAAFALSCIFAATGCAIAQPVILSGPNPANGAAGASSAPYTSVTAGTLDYQPVGPRSWREMNDAVAPRAGRAP